MVEHEISLVTSALNLIGHIYTTLVLVRTNTSSLLRVNHEVVPLDNVLCEYRHNSPLLKTLDSYIYIADNIGLSSTTLTSFPQNLLNSVK